MTKPSSGPLRGALFSLGAFGLFATHDVIIKFLGGTYTPFQIIFFSTLMSFPLTTMMLMRDPARENLRPVHPWWTALRTGCAVIATMCAFYAFSTLPLAQTYAILFAMPLIITVLSIPVLNEKVGWRRWIAVIVGLSGVIVVLRPGTTDLQLGHLAALAAACFSATASVIVRKIGRDERSVVLILYPIVASFVLMAVLMPADYQPMPILDLGAVALISVLGFSAGLMLIAAYKNAEAAIVAPMQYSQIIWATLFGYVLFDETVDGMTFVGAGVIIASGLYIVFRESVGGGSANTPVLRTRSRGYGSSFRISPYLRKWSEK
ncbi:MAG: DMT family transporter [Pseudomonadota bacterium]